ncbi:MAG: hypothetical protein LZF60_220049 [Nitrospira sp.]|nr:hypothetical protein [Nitrospira sp.]ULA60133.1 MAG: hypothetical protein LZF60_220049 [Nitrospira sp.]
MHYGYERVRQIQVGCDGQGSGVTFFVKALRCVGVVAVAGVLAGGIGTAWAVPKETSKEKAEHLRQQANPQLFNDWTFDKDDVGSIPKGFVPVASGDQQAGSWKVEAQAAVPSAPNVLLGTSGCGGCHEILVAQGFQYEYPDLVVRIQQGAGLAAGQVGVVFGMKDAQNYYATVVDIAQKTIQVVRVIDGKESVLGRAAIKVKPVEWHTLRVQRNTIISKDFVETFFDGSLALSVEDQALGVGQVGMLVRGDASARFDNFNAAPLYSSRPLSAPAAY